MNKAEKYSIGEWVEGKKVWIGGGLIVLILLGGGVMFWRENYWEPDLESRIMNQESRISVLESQISEIEKSQAPSTKTETNSNPDNSNAPNEGQGQVAGAATASQGQGTSAKSQVVGKININTASAAQLDSLPGIGATYAGRIIEYRNSHGGFKTIEEIKNVKGIGDKTFEKFKNQISI